MPIDASLAGREFPETAPYAVTADAVAAFAESVGAAAEPVPPTFPIVVTFEAMLGFLEAEQVDLSRIVHGDQKFSYTRPVRVGDELRARLRVEKVRSRGGADFVSTTSEIVDADDATVCTAQATLVHRSGEDA
ncbi:MaoC family dehydratase N-terminal domain-containing protein [Nocardioides panacisoli]|uniref:FAS1-like dehydratase domain-containing protein n=1 Tax=Nocardioides panacisoli TaxID=627624 RepID=UPI001C63974C|nr:MaoC family dehydratase N-terminal domain-containing protein [Nocardioides panacisoli]QYJ03833.1 MaoC family dehydratase N-terminal domain-containing protein [Nocardioides panacisoli]